MVEALSGTQEGKVSERTKEYLEAAGHPPCPRCGFPRPVDQIPCAVCAGWTDEEVIRSSQKVPRERTFTQADIHAAESRGVRAGLEIAAKRLDAFAQCLKRSQLTPYQVGMSAAEKIRKLANLRGEEK